jgi:hypothetical protein
MKLYLHGIGVAAPGLLGWPLSQEVLAGRAPYAPAELPPFTPTLLPANERRRATRTIKLALQVAQEALEQAGANAAEMPSVFATSEGDIEIADRICRALAMEERPVSPTDFHNSVHNAPSGYFAIACGSRRPSTSLSAADGTLAAGLLEAATQLAAEPGRILLICYDQPAPEPLASACPMSGPFGAAFVLGSDPDGACAALELRTSSVAAESVMEAPALETVRRGNPAGRALPLLAQLATGGEIRLPLHDAAALAVRVTPC